MSGVVLALADRVPNAEAVALSPTMGWLLLAAATCLVLFFGLQSERWRRFWLTMEDPRALAMFRIVFGFFVIANINDMWEFFEFLFTDEGIFPADVARQVYAANQFQGFGDGFGPEDPWGFFDFAAFIEFLKGPKYSLLYIWDSPTFFWTHLWVFEIVGVMFMVGYRTRTTGVLTWFLMNSILVRNHLPWEGTELVYRVFLAYLILARSGHAYSVDNWLRCRKLRKQGRLSERDGPGGGAGAPPSDEHPQGLEAVYRLIPAWPRRLMMLQLATIYITTGTLKTGNVWLRGDALYYALNMDHFYRLPPQWVSSQVGTTVFRGMTWAVKIGQTAFSLIIVGLVTRWIASQKFPAHQGARKWGVRFAFAGLLGCVTGLIYVAYPVHFTPPIPAWSFAAIWLAFWGLLWALWYKLGHKPWTVSRVFRWKLRRPAIIDRVWVSRWVIGRRILLVWHLAFHAHIFTLMSVGQFQTAMASATFVFLEGPEVAAILRAIGRRLGKWGVPFIPQSVKDGKPPLPSEDPTLAHHRRDAARLPQWALLVGLVGTLVGIVVRAEVQPSWDWRLIWVGTWVFVAGVAYQRYRSTKGKPLSVIDPNTEKGRVPWAYGPFGRLMIGSLIIWHLAAVATWLMPGKDCLSTFRGHARQVFGKYLTVTTTDQGWGMFAPNPPRSNVFLKILVTDKNGDTFDLKSDVYAEERKPIPWIWNTRLRKMNRRIIGGESGPTQWYRKWHARYHCRQWARTHDGEAPVKVELVKMWYQIPSPEQTRIRGYYVPEDLLERSGHETISYTEHCKRGVMGQLPNYIRRRDGLPLLEKGEYKVWHKRKKLKWDKREEREAKKREREQAKKAKAQAARKGG